MKYSYLLLSKEDQKKLIQKRINDLDYYLGNIDYEKLSSVEMVDIILFITECMHKIVNVQEEAYLRNDRG